jgi:hypothetical protein
MAEDDSHVCAGCMQPAIWLGRLATGRRQCQGSFSPHWRSLVSQPVAWRRTSGLTDVAMIEPCSICFPCDTHLQPSDFTPGFLPINGIPFTGVVSECTGPWGRHLLSLLQRFSKLSRNETPIGRLHARSPGLWPTGFGVEPCFMLYLSAFPKAFASSNLSLPPLHRRALRFRLPGIAPGEGRGYHVPHS